MELREALEEKYSEIDAADDGAAPVPETAEVIEVSPDASAEPAPSSDETAEQKAERARDEAGRFAKETEKPAAKGKAIRPTIPPAAAGVKGALAGVTPPSVPAAPPPPVLKAPQSWKPALREKFSTLPAEMQQEVLRRERETALALQKAAEEAKGATPWTEVVRPYEAQIRAAGTEPVKYVGELLQTAHALTYGPPHQKAGLLANLVMQFGPDLLRPDQQDANGNPSCPLDRALVQMMQGRPMQAQPQQQFRDPRLDKLLADAQEKQRAKAAQQEAEAGETTQSFSESHDFYGDVKEHMADILDVWAKQGKTEVSNDDLERAYNLACNMNPDVAPLLEQRRAAEAAQKAAASTARARKAASSVRSSPTAAASAAQPKDLRGVLEAKADELEW